MNCNVDFIVNRSNTKSKQSQQHVKSKSPPQRPPSTVERSNVASPALSANSNNSSSVLQPPVPNMAELNMFMNMMMGMGPGGASGLGSNPLSALMPPPPSASGFGDMPMELIAAALANPSALAGLDPSMFSALAQLNNLSNAAAATSSSDIPDMSRQSRKPGGNSNSKQSSSSQPQSKRLKLSADESADSSSGGFPGLDLSMKKSDTPSRSSTSKTKK